MYNRFVQSMTANAKVATVPRSIPASSDTVESEGLQMKQCWIQYIVRLEIPEGTNRFWLYSVQHSICMVNFCWELTDYGKRTRFLAIAGFSSTPYPPATQKENIRKGSLTRVSWLQFPSGPFEFLRKSRRSWKVPGSTAPAINEKIRDIRSFSIVCRDAARLLFTLM
jgi:hypothetical protein